MGRTPLELVNVRDGYFPDAVFAEPAFILPVIHAALLEWIDGIPTSIDDLFLELEKYPAGQRIVIRLVPM